ncbi:MAG: gamma-glutamylcyclotransferase [Alphaproteobacteria bacterium]|nr:MAG: gamma-glutamylcyclotransferase [Alphaproteobacteria bacterium]
MCAHTRPRHTRSPSMPAPRFFGYGSLVNTATHDFPDPQPARLAGWRRQWVRATTRPVTFLSVRPDPDCAIEGITAAVPGADWAALDAREAAYDRLPLPPEALAPAPDAPVSVYRAKPALIGPPSPDHPILLSYLDTVIAGFLALFGEAGVARFFATTEGWEAPILDDRAAPRYPRATPPDGAVRALVDAALAQLGARAPG